MKSPPLAPPILDAKEVETICEKLAEGIRKCHGISAGGTALMWDCLLNVIQHYKHLSWNDAIDQGEVYMIRIDPNRGNDFQTLRVSCDWYDRIRCAIYDEFDGYFDDVINIGMQCIQQ